MSVKESVKVEQFGALAGRVIARLAKQVELSIAPMDLSLPQYRVLSLLAEGESGSSALAERMAVTAPSVTSVVDGLVARGLVARHPDPSDRRRLPLALTDGGTALLRQAHVAVGERLGEVLGHLDAAGRATVGPALDAWADALDAHREKRLQERRAEPKPARA